MNVTNEPEERQQLSSDKVIEVITALKFKVDATNEQVINLSMLMEYLFIKLEEQNITIDMSTFPSWAEEKFKELEQIAKEAVEKGIDKEIEAHLAEERSKINLSE